MKHLTGNAHWLLRIALASVFIYHGVLKFLNLEGFAAMLPISYVEVVLVAAAETGGGLLVLLGGLGTSRIADLATRIGAALNIPVMLGAIALVHWGRWNFLPSETHPMGGFEFQAVLLLVMLYLVITGNQSVPAVRAARLRPARAVAWCRSQLQTQPAEALTVAVLVLAGGFGLISDANAGNANEVRYNTVEINDVEIFYREAGDPKNPTIVLLHGFPTSSHMFRDLIPALADEFHLVAPDYPGYGFSAMPAVDEFDYSFDNMADFVEHFLEEIDVERYSLYLMDYGAPIGFRIAADNPEQVETLIIQNGNAYDEGIDNDFWEPIKAYWDDRDAVNRGLDNPWWTNVKDAYQQPEMANEDALRFLLTLGATKWQYTNGVPDAAAVSPDNWGHVQPLLDRDGNQAIQLEMFYSYGTNPPLYPEWQAYFREYQPPTLIVWGENDEIFPAAGAHPYQRDLDNVDLHLIDTGHFALETHGDKIAGLMRDFLRRNRARTVAHN